METIFHLFNIKTSNAKDVFEALTTEQGLSKWWTTIVTAEPVSGSIAEFRFTESYSKKMKVITLEENEKVEWECIEGDEQWLGTKIIFKIIQNENSIDIKFYHNGWKEQTDLFGICNYHWGLYMKSLKSYIETGIGNPHKPNLK